MTVQCAAGLSRHSDPERAVDEVCAQAGMLGADLALVFFSGALRAEAPRLVAALQQRIGPRHLVGCSAQGAIANSSEVEAGSSLALWCATLPGTEIESFHAHAVEDEAGVQFEGLPGDSRAGDCFLLFPDPFSIPLDALLGALPAEAPLLGGVASAAAAPGQNRLVRGAQVYSVGCVGVRLRGADLRPVVSQGCRPIGRPFVVPRANDDLLFTLAGRPAFEQLQEVLSELPEKDRQLARRGLQIGRALDEYKDQHSRGDFLIRSVLGVDPKSGALAVADRFRVGQTVQFQVRDGNSAREDLERILRRVAAGDRAKGALLFACNGRGSNMYGAPDGDVGAVEAVLGRVPLAGFFAGGEIGPVGGANHLHGFTASLAVFF